MSNRIDQLTIRGGSIVGVAGDRRADVAVAAGRVTQVSDIGNAGTGLVLDATGCHVVPGFIDTQINGAFGIDFSTEPHRVGEVAAQLPQFGVTAFCPTVITGPADAVPDALRAVHGVREAASKSAMSAARVLGVHAEGPFIAPTRSGTHPFEHVRAPSRDEVSQWLEVALHAGGVAALSMVTLAPELPGADVVIDVLVDAGITVSAGHTEASAAEIAEAADRGVSAITHLFNAMSGLGHRTPGAVGGTLVRNDLVVGLIVDGVHVDPVAVDIAWRILGPTRTALVTDSIAALGCGDGRYELGGVSVEVVNGIATNVDGALAGSTLSMDTAVRNLIEITGCTLHDASQAASATPARIAGASAQGLGTISSGQFADLVLLDESLGVVATVVGGVVVHDPQQRAHR